jgi:hypothetical protein
VIGLEESREGATMALLATRGTEPKLVGTAFVTLGGKERETFWSKVYWDAGRVRLGNCIIVRYAT